MSGSSDATCVYHYTNLAGVLGIFKSRSIWLTDFRYLNDATEGVHFLTSLLKDAANWDSNPDPWFLVTFGLPSFLGVACFTTQADDLSQWRGYGSIGQGVALQFDKARLERWAIANDCRLIECEYEKASMERAVAEVLESCRGEDGTDYNKLRDKFEDGEFLRLAAKFKDRAFRSECEWRLVSRFLIKGMVGGTFDYAVHPVKYRQGATSLIPYLESPPLEDEEGCLITGAVVGPTPQPNLARSALEGFFRSQGIITNVVCSAAPYRAV